LVGLATIRVPRQARASEPAEEAHFTHLLACWLRAPTVRGMTTPTPTFHEAILAGFHHQLADARALRDSCPAALIARLFGTSHPVSTGPSCACRTAGKRG